MPDWQPLGLEGPIGEPRHDTVQPKLQQVRAFDWESRREMRGCERGADGVGGTTGKANAAKRRNRTRCSAHCSVQNPKAAMLPLRFHFSVPLLDKDSFRWRQIIQLAWNAGGDGHDGQQRWIELQDLQGEQLL